MATAVRRQLVRRYLRERLSLAPLLEQGVARVDRERGIIYGAKIISPVSENKRYYKPSAVKEALSLYEKRAINTDHPDKPGDSRSVKETFAWLENVRQDEDGGARGDIHLLDPNDPFSIKLMNAAEKNPSLFGLSHNAEGEGYTDERGVFVVERITRVHSVDLVTDPATTRGLFEDRNMPCTIRTVLEAASKKLPAARKKTAGRLKRLLREYDEGGKKEDVALMDDEMDMGGDDMGGKDWRQCLIDASGELLKSEDPEAHEIAKKIHKLLAPESAEEPMEESEEEDKKRDEESEEKLEEEEDKDLEESGSDEIRGKNQDGQRRAMWAKDPENPYAESRQRRRLSPGTKALQERVERLEEEKRVSELKTWLREEVEKRKIIWSVELQESLLPLKDRKAITRILDQIPKVVPASSGRQMPRSQAPVSRALAESLGLAKAPTNGQEFAQALHQLAGAR